MRLYVETNFILELALLREEHEACEDLLDLSHEGKVHLVLPIFSIGETYEAWARRSKQRAELNRRLSQEVAELSRSKPYQTSGEEFRGLGDLLLRSGEEERLRVYEALARVLMVAELIPIEHQTIQRVRELRTLNLSPQDLMIYASVRGHLEQAGTATAAQAPHGFATRNSKDFEVPDVREGLASLSCRLFTSFRNALGYARSLI